MEIGSVDEVGITETERDRVLHRLPRHWSARRRRDRGRTRRVHRPIVAIGPKKKLRF